LNQVRYQIDNQIKIQARDEILDQVIHPIGNQIALQIANRVWDQIDNGIGNRIEFRPRFYSLVSNSF